MFNFQFFNPVQVNFGVGSLDKIGEIAKQFGSKAILLMGQKHSQSNGIADKVKHILNASGVDTIVIDGVEPNPNLSHLIEIAKSIAPNKPNSIVALGGGSVMDAAKLISLILTHKDDPSEYRVTGKLSVPGIQNILIPVITIPTTAGTGSEASPAALTTYNNLKEVYFSPYMYPKATIIDPSLATTLPAELTAQIGMDAFVQSLEAFVSVGAQPFSDMFAVRSMQLVYENLPKLIKDLNNLTLRSQIALAGLLSLYAIGQAGVGAVHALSDPLSGRYNVGHGLALSILLPHVMKANLDSNLHKFESLTRLVGNKDKVNNESADESIVLVNELLKSVGLGHRRLADFGIQEGDFSTFATEADNPDMSTNPKKLSMEERIRIYRQAL